jgi:ATP-binding cassette subfamily B multidrug efflux pump
MNDTALSEDTMRSRGRPNAQLGWQLLELVRPWWPTVVLVGVCVLVAALVELVPPLVVRHIIDDNLLVSRTDGLAGAAVLYLAAITAAATLTAASSYLAAAVAQRSLAGLRVRLFSHLLALPTGYHDKTPVGDSVSRATADVETIDDLFSSSIATLLAEMVGLVTVTAAMAVLSPVLTALGALVVPPLVVITSVLRRRVRDAERETRVAVGALNAQLAEDLTGVEVIRAFGREPMFADRFRRSLRAWLCASNRSTLYNAFYAPSLGVLAATATALLLWLGGSSAFDAAGVTLGTLTAFVLLFANFFTPLTNLGDEWQSVQAALAGAERVFAVLDLPADLPSEVPVGQRQGPPHSLGQKPSDSGPVIVDMRDVDFGYAPERPVLHDVTLTVHLSEHVALVGRTGAGKSSVLSLLGGLYAPWAGQIKVGGLDPRSLDDAGRRALLGYVPQAVGLFSGTVTDNITLGDTRLSSDSVAHAAEVAGAATFIQTLPDGYATQLSDSGRGAGVTLSAGQRQLLALARALVTRPAVLLLDEATAVVDGASDAAFRQALHDRVLPAGTAVLTIAHRLATAREAHRVVVLNRGRVVEEGPPAELLSHGGRFADLIALEQAGWDWQHDSHEIGTFRTDHR